MLAAEAANVTYAEVMSHTRKRGAVIARHAAWLSLRRDYKISLPAIGAFFNRDHTTIKAAVDRFNNEKDSWKTKEIERICEAIKENLQR